MVKNTSSGQEIYTKGLATSSSGLGEGALYKSDNVISAFRSLIDTLKTIVDSVRSVGNNAENAMTWKNALEAVYNTISDSGLIAAK